MSITKHTPGPWTVEDPMELEIGLSIVQAGLKTYEWEFIAMVCQSEAGNERMGRQRFISPKEQAANARLIAAAPELLEAVKALNVGEADIVGGTSEHIIVRLPIKALTAAAAAIAKAEGRS